MIHHFVSKYRIDGKNVILEPDYFVISLFLLLFCIFFILFPLGNFVGPITGGVAATFGFFFGHYLTCRYFKNVLGNWSLSTDRPHEVIDGFVKWEEGDSVLFHNKFKKRNSRSRRRLIYVGVTDNNLIVFHNQSRHYRNTNPNPKNVVALPPMFVKTQMKENPNLKERFKKDFGKKLLKNVKKESDYDEYLSVLNKELQKLEE